MVKVHWKFHRHHGLDDKFSTVQVILPSHFSGRMLYLSHSGQTKIINFALNSSSSAAVVGYYTGIKHKMEPVESSYCFSLYYDLLPPANNSHVPRVPEVLGVRNQLCHALASFKEQPQQRGEPKVILLVLQNKYTDAVDFSVDSLKGADALLFLHIRPLSKEPRLCMCLAHITITVHGEATLPTAMCRWGYGYVPYSFESDRDIIEVPAEELELDVERLEEWDMDRVVRLDGMPFEVSGLQGIDIECFRGGRGTWRKLDKKRFDRLEKTRVGAFPLSSSYKRAALFIWPKNCKLDVHIGNVHAYASHLLQTSISPALTEHKGRMVKCLIGWCAKCSGVASKDAIRALLEAALRWNDIQLLSRISKKCCTS
ncbi:hypothetical protein HETIRDRAFT_322774 [Heterobasidion irregulare TC 32-1]|uniref:Uncharacterized protein n=1 Tax=Heterobasidion irregulare (strain TC 32-1) TaxID=747525 RepID=W4K2P5_HETIT|nr:uncharacterized protein HETIRDRAFT_322774 [Heterobasidion irregulare TC 32-1]ETW80098.1 hypothetical protein HETIRDRAFT_322774 [Heterobasidion irregulare TC 32-1]